MQVFEVFVLSEPLEMIPELLDLISLDLSLDLLVSLTEVGVHAVEFGLHICLNFLNKVLILTIVLLAIENFVIVLRYT
jgi:hypothetical protein